MMAVCHPTNEKFALFHSIDKSWREACYVLTILKLAELYAHAVISTLPPHSQWKISKDKGDQAGLLITKWFKPAAQAHTIDAYWDTRHECVKNASNCMLEVANNDTDDLYWAVDVVVPTPKRKKAQADEESLDD